MPKLKDLFSTPRRAAVSVACIVVIVATICICVVYAAPGNILNVNESNAIGGENARDFAFADAGVDPAEAKSVRVEFQRWLNSFAYEVEFIAGDTEYEYKINPEDGSVIQKETKTVKGPEESAPLPEGVTLEEAREIALADAGVTRGQASFTKAEQDEDNGITVYEFKFYAGNVEYDYEINAQTGVIYSKGMTTYVGQGAGSVNPPAAPAQSAPPAQTAAPVQTAAPAAQSPASASPRPSNSISPPSSGITPPTPPGGVGQAQARISLDEAKSAALADAGASESEAVFHRARMDREDGVMVYEIEFYTSTHEYEYKIDASTGAVRSRSVETLHTGGHHSGGDGTASSDSYIDVEQAKSAALGHAGLAADQVVFVKAELDQRDGRYEVEFRADGLEYEYEIDAFTGAVMEFEWEDYRG